MRLLFAGILLLMVGAGFSFLGLFSPVVFLKPDFLFISIIKLTSILISFIIGLSFVFIGVGDIKQKAQKELIAEIHSDGLLVSCAIIERVNNGS